MEGRNNLISQMYAIILPKEYFVKYIDINVPNRNVTPHFYVMSHCRLSSPKIKIFVNLHA